MSVRQVLLCVAAFLLLSATCHAATESPKKGGLVRKAVAEIIKQVGKYPDYTLFINDIKIATSQSVYKTTNLDPLFNTTVLIPNNKAAAALNKVLSKGINYIIKTVSYNFVTGYLTPAQLKAAPVAGTPLISPAVPPLFSGTRTVYLGSVSGKPSFWVKKSNGQKIVANILTFKLTPPNKIVSAALNPIGVNKVFLM